jgi:hypothetical protein
MRRRIVRNGTPPPVYSNRDAYLSALAAVPSEPGADPAAQAVAGELVLQVQSRSAGFGDHLLGLAIAEGLRRQRPECRVVYVCGKHAHPWLSLFWGDLEEAKGPGPVYFLNHDTDWQHFTQLGLSRWEYWERQHSVTACIPPAKALSSEAQEWAIPYSGAVLLFPRAQFSERTWPIDGWLQLERELLALGFRVLVLNGKDDGSCDGFSSPKLIGEIPERVAALMRNALVVVANDSGPAHLAGMLGVPGVAICSPKSDVNIVGLYPTVTQIGGKLVGFETTTSRHVVGAALETVRRELGEFPLQEFRCILADRDRDTLGWDAIYGTLFRVYRELMPEKIVEIGVRAGYSAWTALAAIPKAMVYGIELGRSDVEGRDVDGGYPDAWKHAEKICPERFTLHITDSHKLQRFPKCDLCYVDGDHSEEGCLADLRLAQRSGSRIILVDDYANFEAVRAAVARFMAETPNRRGRFIASQTGLYVLE